MNRFSSYSSARPLLMALLLGALATGCGGGGGRDPILGTGGAGAILLAPPGAILPGAACPVAAATVPAVTATDPSNGNQFATTSTSGVAGGGKLITATFSLPMNPATINATSFSLAPQGGAPLLPASVSYNAATRVATLTTAAALIANTSYTAVIQSSVTSAAGTPVGCPYAWSFKTAALAAAGSAPVNLGLAAPFGIAATAGVTNTPTAPNTTIHGNVVLDPVSGATCNLVPIDAAGGFGLCAGSPPTINGQVISPLFPADGGATSRAIKADLQAAYLSITPPAGPPAAGSRGGATAIPAGTTLGAPTGSARVQGDNYFVPGVYQSQTSILITGDLTLDALGDPNAVFIFQSSSTVGSAAGAAAPGPHTRILLAGGAKASNIFWQAGSSATLGTNSDWQGNILAAASITMETGASSCGRLFAGAFTAGAFVFDSNVVSVPGHASAPPSCQ
ncbi:ice-binding family protein [Polaromonas sp.]|uniref:ice-binding family protein n=1 Tax=Polaromonas sp. TaxID=1869339 RepID=UPI00286C3070|nr:ice-binding family protein [Polaromonas sp.]